MKPLCSVPFVRAFFFAPGAYRSCCSTTHTIAGPAGQPFQEWWTSDTLNEFRDKLRATTLPPECKKCHNQELQSGRSFRTEVNKTAIDIVDPLSVPNSWNIAFGNICNLSCWTCSELFSSTIAQHKKTLKILPEGFVDPEEKFQAVWPNLQASILESYRHHEIITITILGGEPIYNKTVIEFLNMLVETGLSKKTRIEITTNGSKLNHRLMQMFDSTNWNYLCVFVSVDAIGLKSEWLRYGSSWQDVESSIRYYQHRANYFEIHTVLSILNINDLPTLYDYCADNKIPQVISLLTNPDYMSIQQHNRNLVTVDKTEFYQRNLSNYYELVGSDFNDTAQSKLSEYINKFNTIRNPLADYDLPLAKSLKLL